MKIVVGVDASPHADAAIEFVRGMTWPPGSSVVVVSAARDVIVTAPEAYLPADAIAEAMAAELEAAKRTAAAAEAKLRGSSFAVEARAVQGDPREVLIDLATAVRADLIVVGSHGRTGLAKLVIGSVANHVVTHAPCNVLVVKLRPART